MKVELQISETYEEEKLIVQAPQPTDKVQKVIEFAENLDLTEKIKEQTRKLGADSTLVRQDDADVV